MTMTSPTKKEVARKLSPFLPEVYRAFEHAIFKSKTYFEVEEIRVEYSILSALVRLHVKEFLRNKGFDGVVFYDLALCGLSLKYGDFHIRMWKSSDNELPPPGQSEPRQCFCNQQYTLPFVDDGQQPDSVVNIAILWNLNRSYDFKLWWVCPKRFNANSGELEVEWEPSEIKDPTVQIVAEPRTSGRPADLPIKEKEKEIRARKK